MRKENLERELDAALASYAAVEPREGLEQRVLANLRLQQVKEDRLRAPWQIWIPAGIAAVAMAALVIWAAEMNFTGKVLPAKWSVSQEVATAEKPFSNVKNHSDLKSAAEGARSLSHSGHRVMTSGANRARPSERAIVAGDDSAPRLQQFPAPEPLSEQEKLLIQFVEQDRQDAALVAEIQTAEFQREIDEVKEGNANPESEQKEQQQ